MPSSLVMRMRIDRPFACLSLLGQARRFGKGVGGVFAL
ncbi:hypothetical protein TR2A62_1142 [Thalassobium sp. R2A62]|nr:hypothetical protein TR2A62_1142 [Thalassobium sp. R2A62]